MEIKIKANQQNKRRSFHQPMIVVHEPRGQLIQQSAHDAGAVGWELSLPLNNFSSGRLFTKLNVLMHLYPKIYFKV